MQALVLALMAAGAELEPPGTPDVMVITSGRGVSTYNVVEISDECHAGPTGRAVVRYSDVARPFVIVSGPSGSTVYAGTSAMVGAMHHLKRLERQSVSCGLDRITWLTRYLDHDGRQVRFRSARARFDLSGELVDVKDEPAEDELSEFLSYLNGESTIDYQLEGLRLRPGSTIEPPRP